MVNDPVASFDRPGARRRGNAGSTGRPWTESIGTVRRHDEGSIRRPRPARRAAVCLRGSAVRWSGWCSRWWRGELRLEGLDQVGGPLFRDLPGDEVAAVGVGGDVDVVVPGGAVAGQKRLDALFRAVDSRGVLVIDERDPGRCLDDWRPVMGGCPGVSIVVGVRADRAGDGVAGPVNRW